MRRTAFTLLETLLAISLTASVGIAALSLIAAQAHLGVAARTHEASLAQVTETVRLLDDDLLLAVPQPGYGRFQALERGGLLLVTSQRLPGETPGPHEVVWRFDAATGTALRIATPLGGVTATARRVGGPWRQFAIELERDRLWLNAQTGMSDDRWWVPLWTDPP